MQDRTVVIVGAGAVGATLAAQLVRCPANHVAFTADEARLERLREAPPRVNGRPLKDVGLIPLAPTGRPVDLIVLAVKAMALPAILPRLTALMGPRTQVLSLLNGIESEELIAREVGWHRTLYGYVVKIDATRVGQDVRVVCPGRYVFGRRQNDPVDEAVQEVRDLFERAQVTCEVPVDMRRSLWWKFMVNVGINPLSAVLRAPYGVFQRCAEMRMLMEQAMAEVVALSEPEGIGLSRTDIEAWRPILDSLDPAGKTSMLQDIEAGRPTEVEIFCGTASRLGRRHGIPTPLNDALGRMIRTLESMQRSPVTPQ